jgi:hypothetical protein
LQQRTLRQRSLQQVGSQAGAQALGASQAGAQALGASQAATGAQQLFGRQLRILQQRTLRQRSLHTGSQQAGAAHTFGASQTFTASQAGVGQQLFGRHNRTRSRWQRFGAQTGSQAGAQAGSQAAGAQAFTASQQPPSRLAFALLAVVIATIAAIASAGNKIRRYM